MLRPLLLLLFIPAFAFAGSSNSLLDVSPDGKLLAVANTDQGTVSIVDLKLRKKLAEYPCGDHPEGIAWAGNSGVFLATVYGDDRVLFYDAAKGHTFSLPVDDEPYGIVTTADGKFAYVSHDYPGTVSEIDIAARKVTRKFTAGANARGIALASDEKTLYVTEFLSAKLHAIDIASGKLTDSWAGYESENLARNVVLHPKRPKAYIMHIRSRTTHHEARSSIFPHLSICDLWTKPDGEKRRRSLSFDTYNDVYVVTSPWEAALSPDGSKLYTIYSGTDDINVSRTFDDDYREAERIGRALRVGKHPRAIRLSPTGHEVYIYNTLDHSVGIYDADMHSIADVTVCKPAFTEEWRRGKELFVTAKPPMGSARWISCASCHPDGLSDGRVWTNPEGQRRTTNLFGLAHTFPLHWSADRDETQDFEYTIRGKLMKGRGLCSASLKQGKPFEPVGLEMKTAGLSKDLDAMAVYTNSFKMHLSPHKLTPQAERGKSLFMGEANCAKCHSGPYYTDSRLEKPYNLHDVGTGEAKDEKMGPKYDTPTLLMVYRTGPYLHDGRAKTLKDVLTTFNPADKHGKTSHLKPDQIDDLVAFLKALPYETPPDETPNTVKDYLKDMKYPRPD